MEMRRLVGKYPEGIRVNGIKLVNKHARLSRRQRVVRNEKEDYQKK
jgi:hypothetical protein